MKNDSVKQNLIDSFKNLSLDMKRNEFNKELLSLAYVVQAYLKKYNDEVFDLPENYEIGKDSSYTEEEMITMNYIALLTIKNQLLLLLKYLN